VRAASLAGEITSKLGIAATAIPGSKGQFDVVADGTLVFSKHSEGRFPEEAEILGQLGPLAG
jgi:selT/selW/selH-like putative selenoprotein